MFTWPQFQVLILSERLHTVTAQFDQLRAVRFQDAINKAIPRRKLNRVTRKDSAETSKSDGMEELREPEELRAEPLRVQQQLLDDETRALQVVKINFCRTYSVICLIEEFQILVTNPLPLFLFLQVELTNLLDTVQETETKMVEMSALNHLMATHVLQQAQQIEHLYDQVR